jgi:hypothetical protein
MLTLLSELDRSCWPVDSSKTNIEEREMRPSILTVLAHEYMYSSVYEWLV